MTDLVYCPFCGSTEDVSCGRQGDYLFAICPTCGAQGPRVRFGSPRDKWSTRAAISPQQEGVVEALKAVLTIVLADEYAVGDEEGIAALAQAAIRAIAYADARKWALDELEELLTRLGYAHCSAVGHEGHLQMIGASEGARQGAADVSKALLDAAVVIGTLRTAITEPRKAQQEVAALASQSDASPPLVGVEKLRALLERAEQNDATADWLAFRCECVNHVREALSRVSGDAR